MCRCRWIKSSVWKQIREYEEIVEQRVAAKEEAKKAASARIHPRKHGLFAGSRPRRGLLKGNNRLRLIQRFNEIGKDRLVEDESLLPRLLAESLEENLDYYVLLPRPALVEAREHGQEIIPVGPEELDEETRVLLEMTKIPSEEPKSEGDEKESESR